MVPVGDVGLDEPAIVAEQRVERLALLGWLLGQLRAHVAGRDLRQDGILADVLEVIGDEVGDLVHRRAE